MSTTMTSATDGSIYTPSEQMFHALCEVEGPWRLFKSGAHEGYLNELYPQSIRLRGYAIVIADHADAWLRQNVRPKLHVSDTRVMLQPKSFEWVINQRSQIQRAADEQDVSTDFLRDHALRWTIAEQLSYRHQLGASLAMDIATLLVILYFLYPDQTLADTPREYAFALPHAERLWRELAA